MNIVDDDEERAALRLLKEGYIRLVHNQRKRTLRKRGVRVWWNRYFGAYVWSPTDEKAKQ